MQWHPDVGTKQTIKEQAQILLAGLKKRLGVDELIPGCEIIDMDPDGVGTVPRYITVAANEYHIDVLWRGYPALTVGDDVIVVHFNVGDLYEILGMGGTGASEIPLEALADYARGYIIRGGLYDWEAYDGGLYGHILVGDGTDINSVDAHGDVDILADGEVQVLRIRGRVVADMAPNNADVLTWDGPQARWEPAVGGGGGAPAPVAQGDMLTASAVPAWQVLARGLAHQMLKMNAAGLDPNWEAFDWDEMSGVAGADMVHDHSAAGEGGQLDWDVVWSDAVHDHQSAAEGGVVDKISEGGNARVEVAGNDVEIELGTPPATGGFLEVKDENGNDVFTVDSDGAIMLSSAIAVRVYRNAVQAIGNGAITAVSFTTERYDLIDDNWVIANPTRLTCSGSEGIFNIFAGGRWANNVNGRRYAAIRLNGSTYIEEQEHGVGPGGESKFALSTQWELSATDYVELIVYQSSGGALNLDGGGVNPVHFGMVREA